MSTKLIEIDFPIREISNLAIPERSSYKPIYQVSKWFARRSSSTFRAILLGSVLPPDEDLMQHFYLEHDFSNMTVFDPFVGGGTTIIEGLRLGFNCIGIDINPIAWFITKTEAVMIDIPQLKSVFVECEEKIEKNVKRWYLTNCPICNRQADIIYVHWVSLVTCNVCTSSIPLHRNFIVFIKEKNASILCPECDFIFDCQYPIRKVQVCPKCKYNFDPLQGNRIDKGNCKCRKCGNITNLSQYRKKMKMILPTKMFAIEGYCPWCAVDQTDESPLKDLNYKFIKSISKNDLKLFNQAEEEWEDLKENLLWPSGKIPSGLATKTLLNHNYKKWEDLFNKRQLLALSLILSYINGISNQIIKEMLLAAFINLLNHNNVLTRYSPKGKKVEGIFARHDFHPLSTYAENNVWGTKYGRGTWRKCLQRLLKGKQYNISPYDSDHIKTVKNQKRMKKVFSGRINGRITSNNFLSFPSENKNLLLLCQDSANILDMPFHVDLIISDPPYADNVNYAELSDFFYVWIRLILSKIYPFFKPEEAPKLEEAIESKNRTLDYYTKLSDIFRSARGKMDSNGLLVFTFHHSSIATWIKLSESISNAGFYVVKTHSIPSEARNVLNIQKKKAVAFDTIIVCRIKSSEPPPSITFERFKNIFKIHYQKYLDKYRHAEIKISELDWLTIFFGELLEVFSRFTVITPSGKVVKINEVYNACRDMIETI